MFALKSRVLRRRLSAPTSGSARRRAWERVRAKQNREEGERFARERKEQRKRDKLEQQQKALAELSSYEPWGRSGCGAPNPLGVRFTDLRASGIYPDDELRGVLQYFKGSQGWRTPRRLRLTPIRLREDPEICYADNLRSAVDIGIRYRQTPEQQNTYKHILDKMVETRKKAAKEEVKRSLDYERKMQSMAGPWGTPGPGGTFWRNPRDIGFNFSKSMGWTDNKSFRNLKRDHERNKISSLALPQVKKDDDYIGELPEKDASQPADAEKLPNIIRDSNENNTTFQENNNKLTKEAITTTDRNSRQIKRNGKFVKRLSNGDRVKRTVPDKCVKNGKSEDVAPTDQKKLTPESSILRLTGGVELVPLLARRRPVGARTLPSSDITRPPEQACQWRELLNVDYLRELKNQIRVKSRQKEERRQDSAESSRQHHETWASLWGRPGHGAPLPRGRYARSNLAQLLYLQPLSNYKAVDF